jgi:hypothetical protein
VDRLDVVERLRVAEGADLDLLVARGAADVVDRPVLVDLVLAQSAPLEVPVLLGAT